ncbi:MAG TPA: hypothetical protein VIS77_13815 [Burkholderiales bacterium]
MPTNRPGLLSVWNDIDAEHEAEFSAWYTEEHFGERLALPGFVSGQRYRDAAAPLSFAALYDTLDFAVLESPAYRACLANPSPRTRSIMPRFRNMVRGLGTIEAAFGAPGAGGAWLAVIELAERPAEDRLRAFCEALLAQGAVARVRLAVPRAMKSEPNPEAKFRAVPDRVPPPFLLVEGEAEAGVRAAAASLQEAFAGAQAARVYTKIEARRGSAAP